MGSLKRTVALVGMMGAGKSSLGRRLAARLKVPFHDADTEIETAAGCSINQIFERYGDTAFRYCERKVIARRLADPPHVLATGGGAFLDDGIRAQILAGALSVWIDVPLEVLVARVERRDTRPLLKNGNARDVVSRLLEQRQGIYALADFTIAGADGPHGASVRRILDALEQRNMLA